MQKNKLPQIKKKIDHFLVGDDSKVSKKDMAKIILAALVVASVVAAISDANIADAVTCGHGQHSNY